MSRTDFNLNRDLTRLKALSEGLEKLAEIPRAPAANHLHLFKQKTTPGGTQEFKVREYKTRLSKHWAIFKSIFNPKKKFYTVTAAKQQLSRLVQTEVTNLAKTLKAAKDTHGSLSLDGVASVLIDVKLKNQNSTLVNKIDVVKNETEGYLFNIGSKLRALGLNRKEFNVKNVEICDLLSQYERIATVTEQLTNEFEQISENAKSISTEENINALETRYSLSRKELRELNKKRLQSGRAISLQDCNQLHTSILNLKDKMKSDYETRKAVLKAKLIDGLNKIVPINDELKPTPTMFIRLRRKYDKMSSDEKTLVREEIKEKLIAIRTQLNTKIKKATNVREIIRLIRLVNKLKEYSEISTVHTISLVENRLEAFKKPFDDELEMCKQSVENANYLHNTVPTKLLDMIDKKQADEKYLKKALDGMTEMQKTASDERKTKIDAGVTLIAQIQTAINNYNETVPGIEAALKALHSVLSGVSRAATSQEG